MTVVWIGIGGFLGAICRFLLSGWFNKKSHIGFPYGTLFVNLLGSFLLGLITGMGVSSGTYSFFGIGFMGAFTTFSTFKLENIQLHDQKKATVSYWYLGSSYIGGLLLAFIGMWIGMK
ncbi:fluoride efflux transporter CrcB [Priestia koreensis]|uniref:fluoride efflux transporter CrcB n=1 Tax=Priestia koreensis TaxID=284581 RepID=UPI001F573B61|nr:fluoride efflux transporter CrcB [Priestia koreensis]UNL86778.1 fluoride efflux transporter CrcB [Priestia koreensis]